MHIFCLLGRLCFYHIRLLPGEAKETEVTRDGCLGKEQVSEVTGREMDKRNKTTFMLLLLFLNAASADLRTGRGSSTEKGRASQGELGLYFNRLPPCG